MTQASPSHPIRHLVFDMGGVLVQIDWHGQISRLLGREIPFDQIHALWGASRAATDFESGRIGFDAFTAAFINEQQLNISAADFQQQFMAIIGEDMPGVCELLTELKPHFTLSLLSNTNEAHLNFLRQRNTFLPLIENPFNSLDFGVMKPEAEIYRRLVQALDCEPLQILFFDDGQANVDAARALGLNAERVFSVADIRTALASYSLAF